MLVRCVLVLAVAYPVMGYPGGAPVSACHDMTPHHPIDTSMPAAGEAMTQQGANPYSMKLSSMSYTDHSKEIIGMESYATITLRMQCF